MTTATTMKDSKSSNEDNTSNSTTTSQEQQQQQQPPTVAVIGCGPSGMFFLHAIETQRRELLESGDAEGLQKLPIPTVFERAASPGGVWRAEREFHTVGGEEKKEEHAPDSTMYEALWTNGAKENTEFFDYTYDEHFKCRLPVHLPRRAVLDYMLTRVTRHCPTLFEDYCQFHTSVTNVTYNEDTCKFQVTTKNSETGITSTDLFDKCIWAAGDNGKPSMPLLDKFTNFTGTVIHSSDAKNLREYVKDKRVLMVGGSFSAEDLALMSIKLGVEHIYISHRGEDDHVVCTSQWPQNKVTLLGEQVPTGANGRSVEFAQVEYDLENPPSFKTIEEHSTTLDDIDTVIMCTGYQSNFCMLEEKLRPPTKLGPYDDFGIPKDWKMSRNSLTDDIGDVPPDPVPYYKHCSYVKPGLYRGVLMSNPGMMFFSIQDAEEPLLMCDATAWAFLAYIMGKTKLPCLEEMTKRNQEDFLREFDFPQTRYYLDMAYCEVLEEHEWFHDYADKRFQELQWEQYQHPWLLCARTMQEGHYPFDLGDYETAKLSPAGMQMYCMNWKDGQQREISNKEEQEWRTFRDHNPETAEQFASVFTGTKAVPLKKRWMDIDEATDVDLW